MSASNSPVNSPVKADYAITDEDYDLIYEQDFVNFNKIRTVLCRNTPCLRGSKCTFAHKPTEIRKSICMYHFTNAKGCTKSASVCQHSHEDEELDKSIIDYKKWKNPPKPKPQPTTEELIKKFGEFKITFDENGNSIDSSSDEEIEITEDMDEVDKEIVKFVKTSAKEEYKTVASETSMTPPEEYKNMSSIAPLFPLENIEKNPFTFEGYMAAMFKLTIDQHALIMSLMTQISVLNEKVERLESKKEDKQ